MPAVQELSLIREAVDVFNGPEKFQSATDELQSSGFRRSELSLRASDHTMPHLGDDRLRVMSYELDAFCTFGHLLVHEPIHLVFVQARHAPPYVRIL